MLDESVKNESNPEVFRRGVYEWVKKNIDIKPKNRFQTLPRRQHHLVEPVLYQETNHPNLITRYFHIQNSNWRLNLSHQQEETIYISSL